MKSELLWQRLTFASGDECVHTTAAAACRGVSVALLTATLGMMTLV